MNVRRYATEDEEGVVHLFELLLVHGNDYPPANVIAGLGGVKHWIGLAPLSERWVLEINQQVVGYVELGELSKLKKSTGRSEYWHGALAATKGLDPSNTVAIKRLAIHPHHQRKGYGKELMEHALQRIREEYQKTPVLLVMQSLEPAHRLYESLGGVKSGSMRGNSGKVLEVYLFEECSAVSVTLRNG